MTETEYVINLLETGSEDNFLDFKLEQYTLGKHAKKHEFLKDMSAFANNSINEPKYIIIGVKKVNGNIEFKPIENEIDQAQYAQYLNENIEPNIQFDYKTFDYQGKLLGYFKIYNTRQRPYLVKKDVKNAAENGKIEFKRGDGYIRIGTTTSKMMRNDFEELYRVKHLDKDRREEIFVHAGVRSDFFTGKYLENFQYRYLDISIFNNSDKSIWIDVQIEVDLNDGVELMDIDQYRIFERQNNDTGLLYQRYVHENVNNSTKCRAFGNKFYIDTLSSRDKPGSFIVKKYDVEDDILEKTVVVSKYFNDIKLKVTIYGDDLTHGELIKDVIINKSSLISELK